MFHPSIGLAPALPSTSPALPARLFLRWCPDVALASSLPTPLALSLALSTLYSPPAPPTTAPPLPAFSPSTFSLSLSKNPADDAPRSSTAAAAAAALGPLSLCALDTSLAHAGSSELAFDAAFVGAAAAGAAAGASRSTILMCVDGSCPDLPLVSVPWYHPCPVSSSHEERTVR